MRKKTIITMFDFLLLASIFVSVSMNLWMGCVPSPVCNKAEKKVHCTVWDFTGTWTCYKLEAKRDDGTIADCGFSPDGCDKKCASSSVDCSQSVNNCNTKCVTKLLDCTSSCINCYNTIGHNGVKCATASDACITKCLTCGGQKL